MPDWKSEIRTRLRGLGLSAVREHEITEELSQHLNDRYEELVALGQSDAEAQRMALAELDDKNLLRRLQRVEHRAAESTPIGADSSAGIFATLLQDLRYGLRLLRLNAGFTTVAVLSLALGIGANTAIFQLLNAVRLRALPVESPEELVRVRVKDRKWAQGSFSGRYPDHSNPVWELIRDRQQAFSGAFAWSSAGFDLSNGGQVRYARALYVSGDFFTTLGVSPLAGRLFTAADDRRGCGAPGAVISHPFWQREFGGQPNTVGKQLSLDGRSVEIIGITPPHFFGVEVGRYFDVAVPICSEPFFVGERNRLDQRDNFWLGIMGRLKPGWTIEKATAHLQAISPALYSDTTPPKYRAESAKKYNEYRLEAIDGSTGFSWLRREYETPLWLLLGIAGMVLVIACANLANLMLARATARERELAVRIALGATRARVIRQLLTESLLLAVAGTVLGAFLAQFLSAAMVRFLSSQNSPLFVELTMDWRMLAFTAGLAVLTTLLFGLAPALRATRASLHSVMSAGGRSTASRERFGLRRVLVVSQIALSLVLVASAFLFVRSLNHLLTVDTGFQRDHGILIVDVDTSRLNLPAERRMPFKKELLERIQALPGVEAAASTNIVPLSGNGWNQMIIVPGKEQITADFMRVSPGYFKTMATPLLAGRDFDDRDTPTSPKVAVVTEAFARKFFDGQNPVGKTFKYEVRQGEVEHTYEIVGLVKDSKYRDIRTDYDPIVYLPNAHETEPDPFDEIIVRSGLSTDAAIAGVKRAAADLNPAVGLDFRTMQAQIRDALVRERLLATLSGFFGILAGLLATIGLYGVISYSVVRRTNEIGVRMALGADARTILMMILREATLLLAIGLFIGIGLTLGAGRTAANMLYGLKPTDPVTLAFAGAALALVAVIASLLPAKRAARLQPMLALREE